MIKNLTYKEYAALLRTDFISFVERAFRELHPEATFIPAVYLESIASFLDDCRKGKNRRLVINLPPRSLKSMIISVAYPAWILGHDPTLNIIVVCYGQDLSDKFARDFRAVVMSAWYQQLFPNTCFPGRQATADLRTTRHGGRMATSVGGVLTGRGADVIIIDDPQKPDEALSESSRATVKNWFDNTLISRLNNKRTGSIILVMQRLHQDDLTAHVLEQGNWEQLSFPAIATHDETRDFYTPIGRRRFHRLKDDVLHPEREPLSELLALKRTMGDYNFQAQYQQEPVPAGGAIIKTAWLKYYRPGEEPRFSRIVQSWDTANKSGELNDYSVCTTWGYRDGNFYLLHVYRQRLNFPELKRAAVDLAIKFKPDTILIEDKASGTQLIQELHAAGMLGVKGCLPPPQTDKMMRLHMQAIAFENGCVFLPQNAPWLAEYVTELTIFPGAKHDDQVDSTTQALNYIRTASSGLEMWAKLGRVDLNDLLPYRPY